MARPELPGAPRLVMRFEHIPNFGFKSRGKRKTRDLGADEIQDGDTLLPVLADLVRVAPALLRKPELVQTKPPGIGHYEPGSLPVHIANRVTDLVTPQKPILLRQRHGPDHLLRYPLL